MTNPSLVVIGVHVGQNRMRTAVAVVELERREDETTQGKRMAVWHYTLRYLQALPAGSTYTDTALRLGEILEKAQDHSDSKPHVCVEASGQGSPVVETVTRKLPKKTTVWTIHLNHGDRRNSDKSNRTVTLGKAYLVSRLKVLFQEGRLHLSRSEEELIKQVLDYEVRPEQIDATRPGAFSVGTQDDLITAVGLTAQMEISASVYPGGSYYSLK